MDAIHKYMDASTVIKRMSTVYPECKNTILGKLFTSPTGAIELNRFMRLIFLGRWSIMVLRKDHWDKEYFSKYGFFFVRLLLRVILTGSYKVETQDENITKLLTDWNNLRSSNKKGIGAIPYKQKKRVRRTRSNKSRRRPCRTLRECKQRLSSTLRIYKRLTRRNKQKQKQKQKKKKKKKTVKRTKNHKKNGTKKGNDKK
jgi:hypothetical protein